MVTVVALAALGLCFGSFVNAVVWRIHQQGRSQRAQGQKSLSILNGRSMCPHCGHELAARDLIPVASWMFLKGRCRYCQAPISWQYPLIELSAAFIFAASYLFWPGGVSGLGEITLFATWLVVSVGLLALLVYDIRWMVLPNRILYPTAAAAITGRLVYLIDFEPHKIRGLSLWLSSVLVASGIFWLIFMFSQGRWIGYGDVRLGLITGTVLAHPYKSLLMIFLASLIGTLAVLPALVRKRQSLAAKIPFGPFLIIATGLVLLFGQSIIDWYEGLLT